MAGRDAFQRSLGVSRETMRRFDIYAKLLIEWNSKINLVAKGTEDDLWTRHFLDSGQLYPFLSDKDASIVDVGSGGGFPGAALALLCSDSPANHQFVLLEST